MELSIKKESVLFKVARFGGLDEDCDRTDLCNVFWSFLWGVVRVPFWVALFGVLGAFVLFLFVMHPAIILLVWLKAGVLYGLDSLVIVSIAWIGIGLFGYSFWADMSNKRNVVTATVTKAATSTAGLIVAAYRGWKNKTCVLVAVK